MKDILSALPQGLDFENPELVRGYYEALLNEPVESTESLINLIERFNAVQLLLSSRRGEKIVDISVNTTDKSRIESYTEFINGTYAVKLSLENKIYDKILRSAYAGALPTDQYGHFLYVIEQNRKINCPLNVGLLIEEQTLAAGHASITGSIKVEFDGKTLTLPGLAGYLSADDETLRKQAWEAYYRAIGEKKDELDILFDRLVALRDRIAHNAGFDNYNDYISIVRQKYGYSDNSLADLRQSVIDHVMPIVRKYNSIHATRLGKTKPEPWNLKFDPKKVAPLTILDPDVLIRTAGSVFAELDREFGDWFDHMAKTDKLDYESRVGKAPGMFCVGLPEHKSAFVFANATGSFDDIPMLAHECGHAFHVFSMLKSGATLGYDFVLGDVAEFAAQALELIAMDLWEKFSDDKDRIRDAMAKHYLKILTIIKQAVVADEFQRWVYSEPKHTAGQRSEKYLSILEKYDDGVCYDGYADQRALSWYILPQYFTLPLYFLEYAVAYFGALAIYMNYESDRDGAIQAYKSFLAGGFDRPPDDAFKTAWIELNFSGGYISGIMSFLERKIESLNKDR